MIAALSNIQQALRQASEKLAASSPTAQLDAQVLLSHILQRNTAHLLAWPEKMLDQVQLAQYQQLILQRQQGHPVAHLIGYREFWSLRFSVNNSTLIPRPETETLIEYILEGFSDKKNIKLLDMGTGTGAIAITLACEKPDWEITACDSSIDALTLAENNNTSHQTKVSFVHSNWFSHIAQCGFDIIVSNPPYIANNDPHLLTGDVRYEPESALTSGDKGMNDIEHLCSHAQDYLTANGHLIIEHGYNQKIQVARCFANNAFTHITQKKDLAGHTRMTAGSLAL